MGFTVKPTTFPITFEGTQYEGLELVMKRPSLTATGDLAALYDVDVDNLKVEDVRRIGRIIGYFTECLISWNIDRVVFDDSGNPTDKRITVPADAAGVNSLDDYFVLDMVLQWLLVLKGDGVIKTDIPMTPLTVSPLSDAISGVVES